MPATAAAAAPTAWNRATTAKVHHAPDRATGGRTDADKLYFACSPDHTGATRGDYHTPVTDTGRLAWTDHTGPPQTNHAHHPDELLQGDPDPPEENEE
jgi:hypothetical protein